ncbi:alpha/beta hydrolase [Rhodococcus sovatensis]|uniref:Alpha/beta hydrolase n=1 Tax=Rhodococcus sovatensis TaxID=1805840 RepID=A0ABZ2PNQ8_9NOCA
MFTKSETVPRPIDPAIADYVSRFDAAMSEPGNTISEARARYRQLLAEQGAPDEAVISRHLTIPTRHGDLPARLYLPHNAAALMIYAHGGGFAVGDLDSPDRVLHTVSLGADVAILSLDYALAPENMYPIAFEQCKDAILWAEDNRDLLGVSGPLGMAGDSAGGNLTALLSHWAANEGGPTISWQALINPVLDFLALEGEVRGSYAHYGASPMLSTDTMRGFMFSYFVDHAARVDSSPLHVIGDYSILPPTFVAAGQCDALRDEGICYASRLAVAGVPVSLSVYEGMPHNFITLTRFSESAQHFVEDFVREARRWAHR